MTGRCWSNLIRALPGVVLGSFRRVYKDISDLISNDPESAFEKVLVGARAKLALGLDVYAERRFACELRQRLGSSNILVVGEESLRDTALDLSNERRVVFLLDVIDGTDLVERSHGNWGSVVVAFNAAERRILGSFVLIPETSMMYFATHDMDRPMKVSLYGNREPKPVSGPSPVRELPDASVAFYGQKAANYLSLAGNRRVARFMRSLKARNGRNKDRAFRIYNFGGIPQMVRLIDGYKRIDAVIDAEGQAPHDMVAGAYLAHKAGATLTGLGGEPINLAAALLRPADPTAHLRYILASTPELGASLLSWFQPERLVVRATIAA